MDLTELLKTVGGTLLRHGGNAIGSYLIAKGYLDADTAASFVNYLVGGGLIVIAAIASIIFKKKALNA
jgi:hypothetical protein